MEETRKYQQSTKEVVTTTNRKFLNVKMENMRMQLGMSNDVKIINEKT